MSSSPIFSYNLNAQNINKLNSNINYSSDLWSQFKNIKLISAITQKNLKEIEILSHLAGAVNWDEQKTTRWCNWN